MLAFFKESAMSTPRRKGEPVTRVKRGFEGVNKNARIVKFGGELLTDRPFSLSEKESKLQMNGGKGSSEISVRSKRPFLANFQMLEKRQVSNQSKQVSASIAEVWSSTQNDRTNKTDSKTDCNVSINSEHTTGQRQQEIRSYSQPISGRRRPESYSRRIFDLDQDENELESTLDDPGVFRTDGVGGKSVQLSNVKTPCCQLEPETPKDAKMSMKRSPVGQRHPQNNRPVNNSNTSAGPRRSSSSAACTADIRETGMYRDRSKSDSNSVRPIPLSKNQEKRATKHSAESNKEEFTKISSAPVSAFIKVSTEADSELVSEITGSPAGSNNSKVEMVTSATQTDEDFSNEPYEEVEITEFDRVLVASQSPLMSVKADGTSESDNGSLTEIESFQHNNNVHEQSESM